MGALLGSGSLIPSAILGFGPGASLVHLLKLINACSVRFLFCRDLNLSATHVVLLQADGYHHVDGGLFLC